MVGYIEKVQQVLATTAFEIMDMESISFYLSQKVEKDCQIKMLKLSQLTYINKIVVMYHLNLTKPCNM